jgi:hypothetical protein
MVSLGLIGKQLNLYRQFHYRLYYRRKASIMLDKGAPPLLERWGIRATALLNP